MKKLYESEIRKAREKQREAREKNQNVEIVIEPRPIDEVFCRSNDLETEGVKKMSDVFEMDFNTLDVHVRAQHKAANNKIRIIMDRYKEYRYETIETLVSLYKHDEIEDQAALNRLQEAGYVQNSHGRAILDSDIIKLLQFVGNKVSGDPDSIKFYLLQRWI